MQFFLLILLTVKGCCDPSALTNPFAMIFGLCAKYSAICTSHLAPSSFSTDRLKLTGSRFVDSISLPSSWAVTCSAYQFSKHLFKKSFAGLFIERSMGLKVVCCVWGKHAHMDVIGLQELCHRRGTLAFEIVHDH